MSVNYEYLKERIGSVFVISINKTKVSTNFELFKYFIEIQLVIMLLISSENEIAWDTVYTLQIDIKFIIVSFFHLQ